MGSAVIATAGTLLAAIVSARQIWHPPDVQLGSFRTTTVTTGVAYDEFQARLVPPHRASADLGLARVDLVAAAPTPDSTGTPQPDATSFLKQRSATTGSMKLAVPRSVGQPVNPLEPAVRRACAAAGQDLSSCGEVAQSLSRVIPPATDGATLTSQQATTESRKLATKLVTSSRTAQTADGRRQIVGAVVDVNLELEGLRGRKIKLSWQLWQAAGTKRIYGSWLNENLAFELTPTSRHDSASVNFWIPLPKAHGPYFLRSRLTLDGKALASQDSDHFE